MPEEIGSVESVILPNGLKSDHSIKVDGTVYMAINTCALDSLVHVIMTSALDYQDYAARVKGSKNRLLKFVWELIGTGITSNLLDERLYFLLESYPMTPRMDNKRDSVVHMINAVDSIENTVENTLESEPSGFRTEECSHCGSWRHSNAYISPNYNTIVEKGFGALAEALNSKPFVSNIKCSRKNCPGTYDLTLEMNFHLFIELDIRTYASGPQSLRAQLKELPEVIELQGQKYRNTGIVGFGSDHFIAYCRRFDGQWHIYNDMCAKVTVCKNDKELEPHLAVYIQQTERAQSLASVGG